MNSRATKALSVASHLALWAGIYVASAVLYTAQLSGQWTAAVSWWLVALFAGLTAAGVYLLDRVKLRDAWLDPADHAAHPARFNFLTSRSAAVRALIIILLAAAMSVGLAISPWLTAGVPLACIGVLAYAGRPRLSAPRIKDVILLKNLFVAGGISCFAAVLVVITASPSHSPWPGWATDHLSPLGLTTLTLTARVFADAALCDLDDESSDRQHGTQTLPTRLGRRRAWNIAMSIRLALGAALLIVPTPAARVWGAITIVTSLALRLIRPSKLRDLVDARFGVEAVLATLYLSL